MPFISLSSSTSSFLMTMIISKPSNSHLHGHKPLMIIAQQKDPLLDPPVSKDKLTLSEEIYSKSP